jgi:hypothetical protein
MCGCFSTAQSAAESTGVVMLCGLRLKSIVNRPGPPDRADGSRGRNGKRMAGGTDCFSDLLGKMPMALPGRSETVGSDPDRPLGGLGNASRRSAGCL